MALGGGSGGGAGGVRAGRAYVELGAKDGLSGVLKRVGARFAAFGKMVLAATGVGGIVGGILGGLSFKDTADDLAKMNDVAKAFGITGSRMSGLFGLLATAGGEFKENLEGVIQFSGTLDKAVQGIGQGAELFDGLKLSAKEIADLSIDEQFYRVLGAIREMPQPLQESKLALLGGTDSMKQWQPLLSMSEEKMRSIAASMAISTVELEEAKKASEALQQAGAAINRVWQQTVILLAPVVTALAGKIVEAMKPAVEWMKGRTLQHLWDEAVARMRLGWEQIRQWGYETWLDIAGFFEDMWYDTEATAKVVWIDLMEWLNKFFTKDFWAGLLSGFAVQINAVGKLFEQSLKNMFDQAKGFFDTLLNALTNPLAAAQLFKDGLKFNTGLTPEQIDKAAKDAKAELDKAGAGAAGVLLSGRDAARQEAENKKQEASARRALMALEGMQGVEAARANLKAVLARIEADRKNRQKDPDDKRLRDKLNRIGATLGTFATPFAKQAFGTQSANQDLGKKLDAANKLAEKGNKYLEQIAAVAGPLVVTAG